MSSTDEARKQEDVNGLFHLTDTVTCPDCDGNGYINVGECTNCGTECDNCGENCATCNGSGYIPNPDLPDSTPNDLPSTINTDQENT